MGRRMIIGVLLLLLMLLPAPAMADEDPINQQVLRLLYGDKASELVMLEDAGDEILTLQLQLTLKPGMNYTYEDSWMLNGTAEAGDKIGVLLYTISENGKPIVWYTKETTVGISGLYQEKVPLQLLDTQHLLITVRKEGVLEGREYQILRKSEEICTELLEYELNLYEEYGVS